MRSPGTVLGSLTFSHLFSPSFFRNGNFHFPDFVRPHSIPGSSVLVDAYTCARSQQNDRSAATFLLARRRRSSSLEAKIPNILQDWGGILVRRSPTARHEPGDLLRNDDDSRPSHRGHSNSFSDSSIRKIKPKNKGPRKLHSHRFHGQSPGGSVALNTTNNSTHTNPHHPHHNGSHQADRSQEHRRQGPAQAARHQGGAQVRPGHRRRQEAPTATGPAPSPSARSASTRSPLSC